jgi:hypothetical protein
MLIEMQKKKNFNVSIAKLAFLANLVAFIIIIIIIYLFTAIRFASGGSSPTLVQTKT